MKSISIAVIVGSQQTDKDKLVQLSLHVYVLYFVCVCVFACLWGTYNSWYEAAWLIRANWKIVRIITGFMEIYFALMCSKNIYFMERQP